MTCMRRWGARKRFYVNKVYRGYTNSADFLEIKGNSSKLWRRNTGPASQQITQAF
jgi:hypothetical protein